MSTRRRRVAEERLYYSPPALRKSNQQQQQQQQEQLKSKSSSLSVPQRRGLESDSNLDRFLEHTTPVVQAQHFSRTSMQAWRNRNREFHPYFILGDLWESFREWSVYGVGVPLVLNGADSVVQYYVPSLSGIQIYADPSRNVMDQRRPGEESDANSSSSDGDNECGTNRWAQNTRDSQNQQSTTGRLAGGDINSPHDLLIYEYFEKELPFHREPLADKISTLSSRFPVLKTYKSCDLAEASWISIAWYPIYKIPTGSTLQNVESCFLTFHSLSKPVRGDGGSKLSLPTFGLVSYKFKISEWNTNGVNEGKKVNTLWQAADDWLQRLQVNHPDFSFFTSHNTYWR